MLPDTMLQSEKRAGEEDIIYRAHNRANETSTKKIQNAEYF